jgi:hypothetical protein
MAIRIYSTEGRKGCVQLRKAKSTGTMVGVYNCEQADLDTDDGSWATVCEDHGSIVNHDTLATARSHASAPEGWCDECGKEGREIPEPILMTFSWDEGAGSRDEHGRERCMRCGRGVQHDRGCEIHIHDGGKVILAANDTAEGRDPAADLGVWVLGPECQRHVPVAYRRPRATLASLAAPEATIVTEGMPCAGLSHKGSV